VPAGSGDRVSTPHLEEVIPSAGRLLMSLRDLGYDFTNAVADLVDNSVSAGATRVEVTIASEGSDSWVRIADNGTGMGAAELSESMRLGSGAGHYTDTDLGKFGLGLKTASLSQARAFTVASRRSATPAATQCRHLDLDDIAATDRWEIAHLPAGTLAPRLSEPLGTGTGTVVVWTKLDRVPGLNDPFGGWAERHLSKLVDRLDLHLGMVFGRFLSGTARGSTGLVITINGVDVEAWDPFCLDQDVQYLPEKQLHVGDGMVNYRPYVLPPQTEFSDDQAWRRASGPNQWNRQQGLYIYRNDRLIQSGGWSWLRGIDEHVKLARAAVEYRSDLDEHFEINISKMRVKLPQDLRDQLKPLVQFISRCADDRYRKSSRRSRPRTEPPAAINPTRKPALRAAGEPDGQNMNSAPGVVSERRAALERAATRVGVTDTLQRLVRELRTAEPEIARDLGW
jgi:hypothetical protein